MSDSTSPPTVVLVHGGFADASFWAPVIEDLQAHNLPVLAPPNPLRGLAHDAEYVASYVSQIDGPVLLVGHSYGGAVITVAGASTPNAVGLVYVAAFVLDEGESFAEIFAEFGDTPLVGAVRPSNYPLAGGETAVELTIAPELTGRRSRPTWRRTSPGSWRSASVPSLRSSRTAPGRPRGRSCRHGRSWPRRTRPFPREVRACVFAGSVLEVWGGGHQSGISANPPGNPSPNPVFKRRPVPLPQPSSLSRLRMSAKAVPTCHARPARAALRRSVASSCSLTFSRGSCGSSAVAPLEEPASHRA
jgi:pimeloyl-ACP methyl ester carboxylesterase